MRKRYIYIGISECMEAVKNTNRLEALAFALLVKLTFVDSTIRSTSARDMKKIFRMGWSRLSKVLKNAVRFGYIVKEGDTYFAPRLKRYGQFNKRLEYDYTPFSTTEDGRTKYSIGGLIKDIRKFVLENHLLKQKSFHDTALVVSNPSCDEDRKKGVKRLKCMCGISSISEKQTECSNRLSLDRAMRVMGTKRSTAWKIIKEMINDGSIARYFSFVPTDIDIKEFKKDRRRQQTIHKEMGLAGFPLIVDDKVCIQYANRYELSDSVASAFSYSPKRKNA